MNCTPLSSTADLPPRYIYALLDEKLNVRYVGQAANPWQRVKLHFSNARTPARMKFSTPIYQWMRSLEGVPQWVVLQQVPAAEVNTAEQRWIDFFRAIHGSDLLNVIAGGFATEEWRAAVSAALMGHPVSPETREKIRQKAIGRTVSEETKAKLRARDTSGYYTEERNRKISETLRGQPHPWQRGRPRNPEAVRKSAESNRGQRRSAETKVKISEAARHRGHHLPDPACPRCQPAALAIPPVSDSGSY